MTALQFNTLSEDEQWLALRKGVQLASREDDLYAIYLFQLDGFYIEVFCHKTDYASGHIAAFESTEGIEPYLDQMKIEL